MKCSHIYVSYVWVSSPNKYLVPEGTSRLEGGMGGPNHFTLTYVF